MLERAEEVLVDAARLLVARRLLGRLLLEASSLVGRIGQLGESVRKLAPDDEELEALGEAGLGAVRLRERRNLNCDVV